MSELKAKAHKAIMSMSNPELDKVNPRFDSKYASLKAILKATRPALAAEGLRDYVSVDTSAGELVLYVTDGAEALELGRIPALLGGNVQQNGSELTYEGRYLRLLAYALVGDDGDEDDDGNAAADQPTPVTKRDMSKLTELKKRYAIATGADEATAGQVIVQKYGDPRSIESDTAWETYLQAIEREVEGVENAN